MDFPAQPLPPPPRAKPTTKQTMWCPRCKKAGHGLADCRSQVMELVMIRCTAEVSPCRIKKKPHRNKRGGRKKREKRIQMQNRAATLTTCPAPVHNSAATNVEMVGPPSEDEVHADDPARPANVGPSGVVPAAEQLTVSSPGAEKQLSSNFSRLFLSESRGLLAEKQISSDFSRLCLSESRGSLAEKQTSSDFSRLCLSGSHGSLFLSLMTMDR